MKIRSWFVFFFLFFIFSNAYAGKLEKGFERLRLFDYFNAKKYFEESLKKDPVPAAYGLSFIYSYNDNPFYNLDSARHYILISDSSFLKLKEKDQDDYKNYGVTLAAIQAQKESICDKAFTVVSSFSTVDKFDYYLREFSFCSHVSEAEDLRNAAAFKVAKAINTSSSYKRFVDTYPEAKEQEDAMNHLDERLYEETTADRSILSYENFLDLYPESPYKMDAEKMIYNLSVPHKTIEEYHSFVKAYPLNRNKEEAWRQIFKLATKDYNEQVFENFKRKFPDYPFKDELEGDYRLQRSFFLPFSRNNLWGYINENGQEMVKPEYEEASLFAEGLAAVKKNGKVGFINKSGKVMIPFLYSDAEPFKSNSAVVKKNDKSGLISRSGDELIPFLYDDMAEPSEDICVAVLGEKSGYVSKSGKKLTDFIFDFAGDFKDGYAIASTNDKYGLLNNTCNYIIKPQYDELLFLSNGLIKAKQNESWGIINVRGDLIAPFIYEAIGDFNGKRALVAKDKKCGFMDEGGRIVISLSYSFNESLINTANFKNGYALIKGKLKSVLLDTSGMKILVPGYDDIGMPSEGLIPVRKNKKWGFAVASGKLKVYCVYDYVSAFENGFAKVKTKNSMGIVDGTGRVVIPTSYEDVVAKNSFFIAKNNGMYGLLSASGSAILPTEFDRIEFLSNKIVSAYKGENLLYVNLQSGKIIWKEKE